MPAGNRGGHELKYTYIAKGKYWRFRHPVTGDCKLPGVPGEKEFNRKYEELCGKVEAKPEPASKDSWAWLIKRYRKSGEFRSLADSTQLDYGKTLDLIVEYLGAEPFRLTTRAMIKAVRDKFADQARKAHKIKQMASRLYSWADEEELVPEGFNPAAKLKRIKRKGGTREYVCWSGYEFDTFFPRAMRPMKTAVMLARYTGQRAEDIVTMTWADFQGDMIRVRQSKTRIQLDIPCHRALRRYIDALKRDLDREGVTCIHILTNSAGTPYNANSLSSAIGREIRKIAKKMEFPSERSIHGLRYMAASDMSEAGCSVAEIEAVLGHRTFKMALKYASQRLRAKAAAGRLVLTEPDRP